MTTAASGCSREEVPARRLSEELRDLQRDSAGRDLTIGELERVLQGRGVTLFMLLMSLPFCFPITIPGLSIPFGAVILLLGLRIAMGRKPALPGFILNKRVKAGTLARIIGVGLNLTGRLEKIAKPRMHFLRRSPAMIKLIGLGLASGGLLLLLPLPPLIPLSNSIPAVSIVLLIAGLTERDGVLVLAGYFVNLFAWVYFCVMFALLGGGVRHLLHSVGM